MATQESGDLRASDADRDRVADRLRDALAEGRLTPEEHGERVDRLYGSRTLAELADLTTDLPGRETPTRPQQPPLDTPESHELAAQSTGQDSVVAVLGGAERNGRWLVEPRTHVTALLGGVELDLREAVLAQQEVLIQCAVVLGGLEIVLPPGVRVINQVNGILGGVSVSTNNRASRADAPTVRLTGTCLLGGVDVRNTPSEKDGGC